MSLITDLNKKPGSQIVNTVKSSGGLPGAVSKLKQAKDLIDSGKALVDSISGLVQPMIERAQGGNQNVSGYELSPTVQRKRGNQNIVYDQPETPVIKQDNTKNQNQVNPANVQPKDVINAINKFSNLLPKGKKSTLAEVENLLKELE